jgi:hypothetical protein
MTRNRAVACLLFLVALAALSAQRAFPFVSDAPRTLQVVVAVLGAANGLLGVRLWLRGSSQQS